MNDREVTTGEIPITPTQTRIVEVIEGMRDEIVNTLSEIVKIRSISPKFPGVVYEEFLGNEGDVSRYLGKIYQEAGADPDYWEVEPQRTNVAAVYRGAGGGKSLIYNGHVDVVPPGQAEDWRSGDPFSGRIDTDRVWGRGTSDMKAGLVAQAYALAALGRLGIRLKGDLILEATVGEETMDHEAGVSSAIERGYRADAAVVSEPSGPDTLAISPLSSGMLWCDITVVGKRTHAAMRGQSIHAGGGGPDIGVNAIDKGVMIFEAIRRLEQEWVFTKTHPEFNAGHFSLLPGAIIGGTKGANAQIPFMLADYLTIDYVVWYPPNEDPEAVKAEIEAHLEAFSQTDTWLRDNPPVVNWKQNWRANNPGLAAENITRALERAHELAAVGTEFAGPASVNGFCAVYDATFLTESGIPAISYGPGDVRMAHADDEYALIEELITATKAFALLAVDWCELAEPSV
jgi:acetylornithine deacetylase